MSDLDEVLDMEQESNSIILNTQKEQSSFLRKVGIFLVVLIITIVVAIVMYICTSIINMKIVYPKMFQWWGSVGGGLFSMPSDQGTYAYNLYGITMHVNYRHTYKLLDFWGVYKSITVSQSEFLCVAVSSFTNKNSKVYANKSLTFQHYSNSDPTWLDKLNSTYLPKSIIKNATGTQTRNDMLMDLQSAWKDSKDDNPFYDYFQFEENTDDASQNPFFTIPYISSYVDDASTEMTQPIDYLYQGGLCGFAKNMTQKCTESAPSTSKMHRYF